MSHDLNLPPQKQSMNFSSSGARLAKFVSYYGIPRKERGCLLQKAFNNQDRPHTPFKLRDTPAKYTYYVTIRNYFGYLIILRIFNLGISCTVVVLTCFVMCGCAYVLLICVLIFIVFCIASSMYIYSYLFCLYQREDYCHRVTTQLQLIIIIFLNGLGRLTCSGIDALPSSPGASTISNNNSKHNIFTVTCIGSLSGEDIDPQCTSTRQPYPMQRRLNTSDFTLIKAQPGRTR